MTAFLVFRLSGAMASWGDVTVGDIRSSWPAPSASALTGLLAAALGIPRTDEEGQDRLAGYRFAVRLDVPGTPFRDYHTVQSAQRHKAPFLTRREELSRGKVHTKLTDRTYYSGQVASVVVWGGDLPAAAKALRHPSFFLCLGRRGCPPSRPLAPLLIEKETIAAALANYDETFPPDRPAAGSSVFWDARPGSPPVGLPQADDAPLAERRDVPVSRGPDWSFAPRLVASATWPEQEVT